MGRRESMQTARRERNTSNSRNMGRNGVEWVAGAVGWKHRRACSTCATSNGPMTPTQHCQHQQQRPHQATFIERIASSASLVYSLSFSSAASSSSMYFSLVIFWFTSCSARCTATPRIFQTRPSFSSNVATCARRAIGGISEVRALLLL